MPPWIGTAGAKVNPAKVNPTAADFRRVLVQSGVGVRHEFDRQIVALALVVSSPGVAIVCDVTCRCDGSDAVRFSVARLTLLFAFILVVATLLATKR